MLSSIATALCAIFSLTAITPVMARPAPQSTTSSSGYWLANVDRSQDAVWGNSGYTLFRNVKDYGAAGDGSTDDTAAIMKAMTNGNRCGDGCNSSTTTPAIVYFPAGTYLISSPIIQYYYTQMIGDATNLPTITCTSGFKGIALIDSDPYDSNGANWYVNQNNFFRQVRNFNLDITPLGDTGAAIHWQVAQATSLQNINFKMTTTATTKQIGIFMDNGSGGFMSDLTFTGGQYGAFFGNQQFTTRNLKFSGCQTAIFMNWNWGWTLAGITIDGSGAGMGNTVGLDMSNSPSNQTVGSVVLADSTISGVAVGVRSAYSKTGNVPESGGTFVLDNVDLSGASIAAVADPNNNVILAPGKITAWASGNGADGSTSIGPTQGTISPPNKTSSLLDGQGTIFAQSKPQYETLSSSSFISVKSAPYNAKGDGQTDDTTAVQNLLNAVANSGNVAYFPLGAYLVTDTITVPPGVKIVGSCWPTILASGFTDLNNPKAVFAIGSADGSSSGTFQMSDMLFEVLGPNPGAIMVQWNLNCQQGGCGIWDSHIRMGGSYGSDLQLSQCVKNPGQTSANTNCEAAFLMFHANKQAGGVYLENTWFWTADHDMEDPAQTQISLYNGRGMLIQAQAGPVWLYGTASEHSILYNYQFDGVTALFAGFMQSETPYMQPNPSAPNPFSFNSNYDDPTFNVCNGTSGAVPCQDAWGLNVLNSQGVLIYSTGFYSFFNDYEQTCVTEQSCQLNMVQIQNSQVDMYAVTTVGVQNMIIDGAFSDAPITSAHNLDVYGATVAYYFTSS